MGDIHPFVKFIFWSTLCFCMFQKRIMRTFIILKLSLSSFSASLCSLFSLFHSLYGHPSSPVAKLFLEIFNAFSMVSLSNPILRSRYTVVGGEISGPLG